MQHYWRSKRFPPVTARPLRGARSLEGLSSRTAVAAFELRRLVIKLERQTVEALDGAAAFQNEDLEVRGLVVCTVKYRFLQTALCS